MWSIALVTAGCVDAPETPPQAAPSAWTYTPESVALAADPTLVAADVQRVVDLLPTVHAAPVVAAWTQARAYGDADCPLEDVADTTTNGHSVYFGAICRTEGDVWFKGPMTTYTFADNTLFDADFAGEWAPARADPGVAWTGSAVRGQVDVYDEAGTLDYNCSCTAVTGAASVDGVEHWFSYVDGPTHWSAPEAPTAWFDAALQAQIYLYAQHTPDGSWRVAAEGTLTGATTTYGSIWLRLRAWGAPFGDGAPVCESDEFKVIVRDAAGERTAFNLAPEAGSCRFCGEVGGGTACVDLAALATGEGAPW